MALIFLLGSFSFLSLLAIAICFSKNVRARAARFISDYPSSRIGIPLFLLATAFLAGAAFDVLDLSDFLFGDRNAASKGAEILYTELEQIYKIPSPHLLAIKNRIHSLITQPAPSYNQALMGLAVGVFAGLNVFVLTLSTAAERTLGDSLKSAELANKELTEQSNLSHDKFESACEVIKQVESIVGAKMRRLKRVIQDSDPMHSSENRLKCCKTIFSPAEQREAFVVSAYHFFSKKLQGQRIRVALFIPIDGVLVPVASTNGSAPNIISIAPEYRHHFDTKNYPPKSIAVEAWHTQKPVIVPNCETRQNFPFFSPTQKEHLKSMFACPLGFVENLGVLMVDSDKVDTFRETTAFNLLLKLMAEQIAVRLSFEQMMDNWLQKLETAIAQNPK